MPQEGGGGAWFHRYLRPLPRYSYLAKVLSSISNRRYFVETFRPRNCQRSEITYGGWIRAEQREYWSNSIRVIHREMKRVQPRCTRVDSGGSVCRYESKNLLSRRVIITFFSRHCPVYSFPMFYSKSLYFRNGSSIALLRNGAAIRENSIIIQATF